MSEAQLLSSVLFALRRLPHVHALRLNSGMLVIGEGRARRMVRAVSYTHLTLPTNREV